MLYWIDNGNKPRIEGSWLDGQERRVLLDSALVGLQACPSTSQTATGSIGQMQRRVALSPYYQMDRADKYQFS